MGSRKENLKKSLGLSEYPWSSDEEENNTSQPDQVTRRQADDARTSVADTTGTNSENGGNSGNCGSSGNCGNSRNSGNGGNSSTQGSQQRQPTANAPARRQVMEDSPLFWSIIESTPRPSNVGVTRLCDLDLSYFSRPGSPPSPVSPSRSDRDVNEARRPERSSADIQRILAFKRLTRNLQLRQLRNNPSGPQPSSRRYISAVGCTRASLFSPEMAVAAAAVANRAASAVATRAAGAARGVRAHCSSRSQPDRSSASGQTGNRNANPPDVLPAGEAPTSPSARYRPPQSRAGSSAANTSLASTDHCVNVDQSDEDVDAVSEEPPAQQQTAVNNADGSNAAAQTCNASAEATPLEEEVVEVDAQDETDTPRARVETANREPNINKEGNAVASNSDGNVEASRQQSPFHGVKRKRDTADENAEPYSVQEFNQSLLRLLECPVCLEWMEPPISQCRRGHLVCSRCRTRLASCPVCRTTFSSVRNRAMEGVAEMLRYPCRHGCGREVRLRRRAPHEASCGARRYHCPAQPCARHPPLAHHEIAHHFQCKHLPILKIGRKHKFSMKVNSEQHDTWLIMALDEYFHLRVDVDIRTWGVIVYVAYIGPKRKAKYYTYEVTVEGQHNSRSLKYVRATHSDLESSSLNVSRQDCFHLTLDQALNFLRFKNRHCEPDKFLDFDVEIDKCPSANTHESKDDSDS